LRSRRERASAAVVRGHRGGLTTILVSPDFLFRIEKGDPATSQHELARLSISCDRMPDER
jgi:hypothetical protein